MADVDNVYRGTGSAALAFMRAGARCFVAAAQGAALASAGLPDEMRKAADAFGDHLTAYISAIEEAAHALQSQPELTRLFPPLSLEQHLRFLD